MVKKMESDKNHLSTSADSLSNILLEQVTSQEFERFIAFSNEEISVEDIEPFYCPNSIG